MLYGSGAKRRLPGERPLNQAGLAIVHDRKRGRLAQFNDPPNEDTAEYEVLYAERHDGLPQWLINLIFACACAASASIALLMLYGVWRWVQAFFHQISHH